MSGRAFTRVARAGSVAAVLAALLLGASATLRADDPPVPDPEDVYIKQLTYGGSGCPQGSVGMSIAADRRSFTLIFDRFVASSGPAVSVTQNRKNCVVTLNLNAPSGMKWSVASTQVRGYVDLPAGVSAMSKLEFFVPSGLVSFQSDIVGPVSKDYLTDDRQEIKTDASTCGGSALLTMDTQVAISGPPGAEGLITVDSHDGKIVDLPDEDLPGVEFVLEPCTPPMSDIDLTPPAITSSLEPPANSNGWNNTDVTVSFTCTDSGSGVDAAASDLGPFLLTASGAAHAMCVDNAGNAATASADVLIDRVAPTVVITSPAANGVYALGASVPGVKTCSDDLSGVDICAGANHADTSTVGAHAFTVTATDKAGNTTTIGVPYLVGGKNECKNNGWRQFTTPTFRNQGQCVSFMER